MLRGSRLIISFMSTVHNLPVPTRARVKCTQVCNAAAREAGVSELCQNYRLRKGTTTDGRAGKSLRLLPMVPIVLDSPSRFENLKFVASARAVYGQSTALILRTLG